MTLHHELFLMLTGLDRTPIRPPESLATIVHDAAADPVLDVYGGKMQREAALRQIRDMLADFPEPGTPAADLTDTQRMALVVAAGAPYETIMDGTRMGLRTTVQVGIVDRGDGGYIVAIGPKETAGATVRVSLPPPGAEEGGA